MIVVVDASAAVKLALVEDGSDFVRRLWIDPGLRLAAPAVVIPEVAAAIAGAHRDGRVDQRGHRRAQQHWLTVASKLDLRHVDDSLAVAAAALVAAHPARGMDALYLATAQEIDIERTVLLSFDERQRAAGEALGLDLMPTAA